MTVTSAKLIAIAANVRTFKGQLGLTADTVGARLIARQGAVDRVRQHFAGPRPEATLGAAEDYLATVEGAPSTLSDLCRSLETFALVAEALAEELTTTGHRLDAAWASRDAEDRTIDDVRAHAANVQAAIDDVNERWQTECVNRSANVATYSAQLQTYLSSTAVDPNFDTIPSGSDYLHLLFEWSAASGVSYAVADPLVAAMIADSLVATGKPSIDEFSFEWFKENTADIDLSDPTLVGSTYEADFMVGDVGGGLGAMLITTEANSGVVGFRTVSGDAISIGLSTASVWSNATDISQLEGFAVQGVLGYGPVAVTVSVGIAPDGDGAWKPTGIWSATAGVSAGSPGNGGWAVVEAAAVEVPEIIHEGVRVVAPEGWWESGMLVAGPASFVAHELPEAVPYLAEHVPEVIDDLFGSVGGMVEPVEVAPGPIGPPSEPPAIDLA